jgi:plasmid replication initiation protein
MENNNAPLICISGAFVYYERMSQNIVESVVVKTGSNSKGEQLKKHVGAIHTSGDLSFLERKLSNILLFHAYDELLLKKKHQIPVGILCTMLGWTSVKNLTPLKEALTNLASTPIQFNLREDGEDDWEVMSILSYARIKGGVCTFKYNEELTERLYNPEIYAMINLRIQKQFEGAYALNLYENCVRYRPNDKKTHGSTGKWSLDLFRSIVGATSDYYDDYRRLKEKIINPSVKQINKVSDIFITPEIIREGRKVAAIRFDVANNPNHNQQTSLDGMSLKESVENSEPIKALPVYKNLIKHGINERLAIAMIMTEGVERMQEVVNYTEKKDTTSKIKNTGAYIKRLVDENAQVGLTEYQKKKVESAKKEAQTTVEIKTKEKIQEQVEAELQQQKHQSILDVYDALPEKRKVDLRAQYFETLQADITKSFFLKEGEKGSMHKVKFINFIESLLNQN